MSTPLLSAIQGTLYSYQASAQDADEDSLLYYLVESPDGMTIDASGLVQWTPANNQVGLKKATIAVSDGLHTVQQAFDIDVANINDAPVIISQPPLSVVKQKANPH